ncbi:MAG: hypothetical protein RSP_07180 [Rhodanobacter sp.]
MTQTKERRMKYISVALLRKEFGLSLLKASTLISEQRAVASRRHRMLGGTAAACTFAAGASDIFDLHWPKALSASLWLAGIALVFVYLHLVHRDLHDPIFAAACSAAGTVD